MKEERGQLLPVQSLSGVHDFNSSFLFYVECVRSKVVRIKNHSELRLPELDVVGNLNR